MTLPETKHLPRDIRELSLLQDKMQTLEDYESLVRFSSALLAATNKYAYATNEAIQFALAQHWLARFKYHINNSTTSSFLVKHFDICAKLLQPSTVLQKLTQDEDSKQLMAILCLKRVAITQAGTSTASTEVKDLLSHWLGSEISSSELDSVEKVATLLYGPGFMALYGDAFATPEDIIEFLIKSGLAVVSYEENNVAITLPTDLTS